MKNAYVKPVVECEAFVANEFVATCEKKIAFSFDCDGCDFSVTTGAVDTPAYGYDSALQEAGAAWGLWEGTFYVTFGDGTEPIAFADGTCPGASVLADKFNSKTYEDWNGERYKDYANEHYKEYGVSRIYSHS